MEWDSIEIDEWARRKGESIDFSLYIGAALIIGIGIMGLITIYG